MRGAGRRPHATLPTLVLLHRGRPQRCPPSRLPTAARRLLLPVARGCYLRAPPPGRPHFFSPPSGGIALQRSVGHRCVEGVRRRRQKRAPGHVTEPTRHLVSRRRWRSVWRANAEWPSPVGVQVTVPSTRYKMHSLPLTGDWPPSLTPRPRLRAGSGRGTSCTLCVQFVFGETQLGPI